MSSLILLAFFFYIYFFYTDKGSLQLIFNGIPVYSKNGKCESKLYQDNGIYFGELNCGYVSMYDLNKTHQMYYDYLTKNKWSLSSLVGGSQIGVSLSDDGNSAWAVYFFSKYDSMNNKEFTLEIRTVNETMTSLKLQRY